jgi:hypothetical protein
MMRLFHRLARLAVIAALPALSACGSATSPAEWSGSYVLVSIDGSALPGLNFSNEAVTLTVIADTLRLLDASSGEQARTQDALWPDSNETERVSQHSTFTYEVRRNRLELAYDCPPNALALCIAPPHGRGRLAGDVLSMRWFNDGRDFRYVRIDE